MPEEIYRHKKTAETFEGKPCVRCGLTLRFKHGNHCVKCRTAWRQSDKQKQYAKEYAKTRSQQEKRKEYRITYRSRKDVKLYAKEYNLKVKYGMNLNDLERLIFLQNGLCSICGVVLNRKAHQPDSMATDHDHVTGKVRGILCYRCNLMIGYAKDDTTTLRNAITYLETAI